MTSCQPTDTHNTITIS